MAHKHPRPSQRLSGICPALVQFVGPGVIFQRRARRPGELRALILREMYDSALQKLFGASVRDTKCNDASCSVTLSGMVMAGRKLALVALLHCAAVSMAQIKVSFQLLPGGEGEKSINDVFAEFAKQLTDPNSTLAKNVPMDQGRRQQVAKV